jgi:hypothetical protein
MWSLQPTCGIVVTSNDHRLHGWSRTMQPLNCLVEQPLRPALAPCDSIPSLVLSLR